MTERLMLIPVALTEAVLTPPPARVMPEKMGIRLPKKSETSRIAPPTARTTGKIRLTTITEATAEIAAFTVGRKSESSALPRDEREQEGHKLRASIAQKRAKLGKDRLKSNRRGEPLGIGGVEGQILGQNLLEVGYIILRRG